MGEKTAALLTAHMNAVTIDTKSKNIYAIKKKDGFYGTTSQTIQVLSANLEVLKEKVNKESSTKRFLEFVYFGGEYYLMTSEADRKRKRVSLDFRVFDPSKADVTSDRVKILTLRAEKPSHMSSAYPMLIKGYERPQLVYSADSSKIAVIIPIEKDRVEIISMVFDENLNLLWKDKKRINAHKRDFDSGDYFLSNEGVLYLSYKVEKEGKGNYREEYDKIDVVRLNGVDEEQNFSIDLSKKDFFISNVSFLELGEDKIRIIAYMYNKWDGKIFSFASRFKGILVADIDSSMTEPDWVVNDVTFEDYLIEEDGQKKDNPKEKRGNAREERNLQLLRSIALENNESIIIGEQFYWYTTSNGKGSTQTRYVHGHILAFKIDQNGLLEWAKKIPRKQESGSNLSQGTIIKEHQNEVFLIFNDHEKNLDPERKKLYRFKSKAANSKLVYVKLDMDSGDLDKDIIFDLKEEKIIPYTLRNYPISEHEILLFGGKSLNQNLIKLIFNTQ